MAKPKTTVRKGVRITAKGPKVVVTKPGKGIVSKLIGKATGR